MREYYKRILRSTAPPHGDFEVRVSVFGTDVLTLTGGTWF